MAPTSVTDTSGENNNIAGAGDGNHGNDDINIVPGGIDAAEVERRANAMNPLDFLRDLPGDGDDDVHFMEDHEVEAIINGEPRVGDDADSIQHEADMQADEEASNEQNNSDDDEPVLAVIPAGRHANQGVYLMRPPPPPRGMFPERIYKLPGPTLIENPDFLWMREVMVNMVKKTSAHILPKGQGKSTWGGIYITLLHGQQNHDGTWNYDAPLNHFKDYTCKDPQNKLKRLALSAIEFGSASFIAKQPDAEGNPSKHGPATEHEKLCHELHQELIEAEEAHKEKMDAKKRKKARVQAENVQAETRLGLRSSGRGVKPPPGTTPTAVEERALKCLGKNPGARYAINSFTVTPASGRTKSIRRPPKRSHGHEYNVRKEMHEEAIAEMAAKGSRTIEVPIMQRTPRHPDHHQTFDAVFGKLSNEMDSFNRLMPFLPGTEPITAETEDDKKQKRLKTLTENINLLMVQEDALFKRVQDKGINAYFEEHELERVRSQIKKLCDERGELFVEKQATEDEEGRRDDKILKDSGNDSVSKNLKDDFDGAENLKDDFDDKLV